MSVITLTRFQVDPANADRLRDRHSALVASIRTDFPGLTEARLGRLDDHTWVGIWRWDSADDLRVARQAVPGNAAAAAVFALAGEAAVDDVDVLDEH
ncbi:Antibiotic biosynthesis monooxygenase [Actinokineospora alba]|uniref:Antibiotic biosynthesis monooxygenase n=1 Tax=Actinokineospora alba TaxID=504798 RepID=A0A1H0FUB0_9PSEU|nr:antibiotic biosynthesis monooxygenase [Actinokineospora alba]TDP69614.1 antibiotic biosynthesis monooxygenase [Actinokineospora alba]SDI12916.1 Antibiotic biosynthesis monooxygenase [Actinokineospora alba]SDN98059.1 Antibiotic biosynthesis monooxygenase [Actinokineospora alba]